MQGQRVFNEIVRGDRLGALPRKGRNNSLVARRNECLIARYYYYGYYKNKCYEDTIRSLGSEFFLSPTTIIALIQGHTDQLQAVKEQCPVLHYFQNRWPHLKW